MTTHAPSLPLVTDDIPQPVASGTQRIAAPPAQPEAGPAPLDDDWPTLAVLSRRYIDRALQRTHGNKTRAADMLGIDRRTLNRIMARDRAKKPRPPKPAG
jgi:DNA-binding NtrC family response regulator